MDLITVGLLILLALIWCYPTQDTPTENTQQNQCDQHEWVSRASGIEDHKYTVCNVCKFIPETGGYEV